MSVRTVRAGPEDPEARSAMAGDPLPGVASLWRRTLGDPAVTIAVLDGPVDLSHPALRGARLKVLQLAGAPGCHGAACAHGTHVASLIFAQHGEGDLKGVAPHCRGLIIPVFSDDPAHPGAIRPCSQAGLARAIEAAVGEGARVINISAGQPGDVRQADPRLVRAVELCAQRGVLIVAAAGNDGCDCLHLPAALPAVLTVGAHQTGGTPSPLSNYGAAYQARGVVARGHSVLAAAPGGSYVRVSGTSFAAPLVAGLAGLLLSAKLARGSRFTANDARDMRAALIRSAAPCELENRNECRRLLAGRVVPLRAFDAYLKGVNNMDELANTAPQPQAADTMIPAGVAKAVAPAGAVRPSGECGCGTQAALQEETDAGDSGTGGDPAVPSMRASASRVEPANGTPVTQARRGIAPSACGCQPKGGLVFSIGELSYDFGSQARLDAIQAEMPEGTHATVPRDLLNFLKNTTPGTEAEEEMGGAKKGARRRPPAPAEPGPALSESPNLHFATAILWTLNLDSTSLYALRPAGPFARETYIRIVEAFEDQLNEKSERLSVPGVLDGSVTLLSGQTIPVVVPELRALFNWDTSSLVRAVVGERPSEQSKVEKFEAEYQGVRNFLDRVYYEMQNTGQSPQERALNFAATNAFNLARVMHRAAQGKQQLDEIAVERSTVCRPDSDCWDVRLTFFDASNFMAARTAYKFTVDVSDVVPVLVGAFRSWSLR